MSEVGTPLHHNSEKPHGLVDSINNNNIDDYDVKLHPNESMFLGALMLQEYPYGVYQPGTTPPGQKIILIQPYLEITDKTFTS